MKVVKNAEAKWDVVEGLEVLATLETRALANTWKKEAMEKGTVGNVEESSPESAGVSTTTPAPEVVAEVVTPDVAEASDVSEVEYDFNNMTREKMFGLLRQVSLLIGALGSPDGITNAQADTLQFLMGNKAGVAQNAIARGVGCTGGNVTMLVDNLQKKKLVERTRLAEDRRVILVSLTDEGVKVAKDVVKCRKAAMNSIFQLAETQFGQQEVATVARFLHTLLPR